MCACKQHPLEVGARATRTPRGEFVRSRLQGVGVTHHFGESGNYCYPTVREIPVLWRHNTDRGNRLQDESVASTLGGGESRLDGNSGDSC
jgi:hypothetical protein